MGDWLASSIRPGKPGRTLISSCQSVKCMSRHSKNNTAHSFFTYHERKKVKDSGTLKSRLSGETLRRFEDCWLCLLPATGPVCTLGGYIYCRSCLIANLASQKEENDHLCFNWELRQRERLQNRKRTQLDAQKAQIDAFIDANQAVPVSASLYVASTDPVVPKKPRRVDVDKAESRAASFWIPENTPTYQNEHLGSKNSATIATSYQSNNAATLNDSPPPSKHLVCPVSKQRLRMKHLVDLHPTIVSQSNTKDTAPGLDKWVCAITKKEIGYKRAVAVKCTGQVVLEECFTNGLLNGFIPERPQLQASDVVRLIPGGTGFVSHNKVFKYRCFFDTTSNSLLNLSHYMTIPSTHSNVPEPVADSLPCRTPSDGVSSVAETYAGLKRYITNYIREVSIFPNNCYDRCLQEAKRFSQKNHALVWEAKEFCRMGCDLPSAPNISECTERCRKTCYDHKGIELGLDKLLNETITKYQGDQSMAVQCFQLCCQGCTYRVPKLSS